MKEINLYQVHQNVSPTISLETESQSPMLKTQYIILPILSPCHEAYVKLALFTNIIINCRFLALILPLIIIKSTNIKKNN